MTVLPSFPNNGSFKDFRDTLNAMLADIALLKNGATTPTPPSFVPGYTPSAITLVGRMVGNPGTNTYNTTALPSAQIDILDGYLELEVGARPSNLTKQNLYAHWPDGNNNNNPASGKAPFLFGIDGGILRLATFSTSGSVFTEVRCSVDINTYAKLGERRVFKVVANLGSATRNDVAAGTAIFYTALIDENGVTGAFTKIGATITGLATNGISALGTTSIVCGTLNASNSFDGSWFYARLVRSNGTVISYPDYRPRAFVGRRNGTFTDQANSALTWAINAPITFERKLLDSATYPRLKAGGSLRVKTLELLPPDGYWGHQWRDYPSVDMDARIAYAKANGYNAVKIASTGDPSEYPDNATMEPYVRQFYASCRERGLLVVLNVGHAAEIADANGGNRDLKCNRIAAHVALHMKYGYDRIVYMDVCNEVQFGFGTRPSTWAPEGSKYYNEAMLADLAYLKAVVKDRAPDVPLAESSYFSSRADLASDQRTLIGQALSGCDIHDLHPYFSQNGRTDVAEGAGVKAGDMAALTGAAFFLGGVVFGECGIRRANTAAARTSWWTNYGQAARDAGVLGGVVFGDRDFTAAAGDAPGTTDYGISGDATSESAIAAWPTPV